MRSIHSFLSILLVTIFVQSCTTYQLSSYYDNSDGIYASNLDSSSYQKIFDDIVFNIPEENLANSSPNLPWGDNHILPRWFLIYFQAITSIHFIKTITVHSIVLG